MKEHKSALTPHIFGSELENRALPVRALRVNEQVKE